MNVFRFARQLEEEGRRTFERLAETSKEEGVRKIFRMVAADEEALARRIIALQGRSGMTTREESRALEQMAERFAALNMELEQARADDDLAAFDLAARYEEGVCRLFQDAAGRETDPGARSLLKRVGELECREARELRSAHDFINAPNAFLAWGEFSNLDEFHNFGRDEG